MPADELIRRAFAVFAHDVALAPPITLRGAGAIDGYGHPEPLDAAVDEPTAAYIESYGFWGLGYLDARSLRHYLPRLIEYALRTPGDPAMAVEALVRTLRPPDRYPPRLATFTTEQEAVVREFLERLAFDGIVPAVQEDAQQALEEWWLPNPRSRPGPEAIAAMRAEPMVYREVGEGGYRLLVPTTLSGSGLRAIPQEVRRIETWGGYLCGDAHTVIAINVKPVGFRSFDETVKELRKLLVDPTVPCGAVSVQGGRRAQRLDGPMRSDSPAEPQALAITSPENTASIRLLEKLGFRFERLHSMGEGKGEVNLFSRSLAE